MREFLKQIETALNTNLYFMALFTSLAIPDICGAIDSQNGEASKSKYIKWFGQYVSPLYIVNGVTILTGDDCYYFRCGILHQGSSQHPNSTYSRILFLEPGVSTTRSHKNVMNNALNIDLEIFCKDIIRATERWLQSKQGSALFQQNVDKFVKRYPNGLKHYIVGTPVIS